MKSLTDFEIAIIKTISKYYPYSRNEVENIYRLYESFDRTIIALIWATTMNKMPQNYDK